MCAVTKTNFQAQVGTVTEGVSNSNGVIPCILALKFNTKWHPSDKGKFEYAAVCFVGIEVHATSPNPPVVSYQSDAWLNG